MYTEFWEIHVQSVERRVTICKNVTVRMCRMSPVTTGERGIPVPVYGKQKKYGSRSVGRYVYHPEIFTNNLMKNTYTI